MSEFTVNDRGFVWVGRKNVGQIIKLDDGFWQFFPNVQSGGYWPTWLLRRVADYVDELNKNWMEEICGSDLSQDHKSSS